MADVPSLVRAVIDDGDAQALAALYDYVHETPGREDQARLLNSAVNRAIGRDSQHDSPGVIWFDFASALYRAFATELVPELADRIRRVVEIRDAAVARRAASVARTAARALTNLDPDLDVYTTFLRDNPSITERLRLALDRLVDPTVTP